MPLCTFDQTHHPHRPPPPRSTLKTTANQQQTPGEQPIILLLRFLFPRLSSVRSPPCATPTSALHLLARHHFHSSQQDAQLQGRLRLWLLAADGMPWNPSLSHLALWGPDAVLRCPRAPRRVRRDPRSTPQCGWRHRAPRSSLEAPSSEHSASFSSLHKSATLLHCFPFIGTPSLFDFFSAARCGCFCLQTTSSPLQDEQLQALLLQFFGTVHCRWDGVEELCSFQGMAWRPTGAAHCIKAASILHHAVFTEPPMGARLQQALGQRVRGWMSTTQSRSRRCGRVGVLIEATSDASDPGEALHAITPTWEAVPVC